jgi:hypothetical protein
MELNISELPSQPKIMVKQKPVIKENKRFSYDDILAKMGMYVDNGKLHLSNEKSCDKPMDCKIKCSRIESISNAPQNYEQNSYIYNKYFKDQLKPEPLVPKTIEEYKQMVAKKLIENKIQRQRINQIKSTKLIMPTNNIHIAPVNTKNLNKFFRF